MEPRGAPPHGVPELSDRVQRQKYGRCIADIPLEDIELLNKREEGAIYSHIGLLFEKKYGHGRVSPTLQKRYKQIKEVVDTIGVSQEPLKGVANNDTRARQDLNKLVYGE